MHDIDFLPAEYRQRHARRRSGNQGLAVALAVVAAVACSGAWQTFRYHQASRQLAEISPHYNDALEQSGLLAAKQLELQPEAAAAELVVYLHHPWPKSQILLAVVASLPEEVVLERLTIGRQSGETGRRPLGAPSASGAEGPAAATAPAASDLAMLRARCDASPTIVSLQGTTSDSVALNQYLAQLKQSPLFSQVELHSLESVGTERQPLFEFQATIDVRPGYGQPGGPAPTLAADAALARCEHPAEGAVR